jgi:hypothetical protein
MRKADEANILGYQFRTEALFLKLFAGVEAEDQNITPRDPENSVQGSAVGLKLAAESWLDLSPLWFLSVDASYGTAFQQYWSLARVGRRLSPRFSLGLEGGALGNEEYDAGRGGAFLKSNLRGLEIGARQDDLDLALADADYQPVLRLVQDGPSRILL